MPFTWQDIVKGGLAFGWNVFNNWINNKNAQYYNDDARQKNFETNELAAENADARTRALYADLQSPKALLEQYKEAGLSPSLMFAGNGMGTVGQGAQGAGANGLSPSTYASQTNASDIADIKLKTAEANKAQAEADRLNGDNEYGKSEIAENWATAGAKNASIKLTDAQTSWQELQTTKDEMTMQYYLEKAHNEATEAYFTAKHEGLKFEKDLATFDAEVTKVSLENAEIIANAHYAQSGAELNEANKQQVANYIKIALMDAYTNAASAEEFIKLAKKKADYVQKQTDLMGVQMGLDFVSDILDTAAKFSIAANMGQGNLSPKPNPSMQKQAQNPPKFNKTDAKYRREKFKSTYGL